MPPSAAARGSCPRSRKRSSRSTSLSKTPGTRRRARSPTRPRRARCPRGEGSAGSCPLHQGFARAPEPLLLDPRELLVGAANEAVEIDPLQAAILREAFLERLAERPLAG